MRLIQIVFLAFGLFMLIFAYFNQRSKRMKYEGILLAYVIGISLILFVLFPSSSSNMARFFGVRRGVDLLTYISIPTLFYFVLILYEKIEEQNRKLTSFVRQEAIKSAKKK